MDWGAKGYFQPELYVANSKNLLMHYFELKVTDASCGRAKWTKYFGGSLHLRVGRSLDAFPFDYHDLLSIHVHH